MENKYSEYVYSEKDIEKAFNMGVESTLVILEKSIGLSPEGQRHLLERMKNKIMEGKISAFELSK
jgi:stalled ribosome rescue protein Dom34